MNRGATVFLLASAIGVSLSSAQANDRSFLTSWTIVSSNNAPWADAGEKPVVSDLKALIGSAVTFRPDRIVAPKPLSCRGPHYEMKSYTPDMLFQGALTDPARQADSLGFSDRSIPTLETGCDGAFDFHLSIRERRCSP